MIKPTVGRVVWFYPSISIEPGFTYHGGGQPLAAIVTHVWGDRMVNLTVADSNGVTHGKTSVALMQGDEPHTPPHGYYCEWMPFQKGQAAKTEALEQKIAGA